MEVYEALYKECLGGKAAPGAGDVRMFVAPFKNSADAGQHLRIETLMALKTYKGEKLVRFCCSFILCVRNCLETRRLRNNRSVP